MWNKTAPCNKARFEDNRPYNSTIFMGDSPLLGPSPCMRRHHFTVSARSTNLQATYCLREWLQWLLTHISGPRYYSTLNISETVQDRDSVTVEGTHTRALFNVIISNDLQWPWVIKRHWQQDYQRRATCRKCYSWAFQQGVQHHPI